MEEGLAETKGMQMPGQHPCSTASQRRDSSPVGSCRQTLEVAAWERKPGLDWYGPPVLLLEDPKRAPKLNHLPQGKSLVA